MPRLVTERADTLEPLAEVFREYGYAGATLSLISQATGLGKGSLYHFFPGGKEEMAAAVLSDIGSWFEAKVFAPLTTEEDTAAAIDGMFDSVTAYFRSGRRACLVGALALSDARDRFAVAVSSYFERWAHALTVALRRKGVGEAEASMLAEEVVAGIQGAIVFARAVGRPAIFDRAISHLRSIASAAGAPSEDLGGSQNLPAR